MALGSRMKLQRCFQRDSRSTHRGLPHSRALTAFVQMHANLNDIDIHWTNYQLPSHSLSGGEGWWRPCLWKYLSETRNFLTPYGCVAILSCHKETKALEREKLCRDSLHVLSAREEFWLQWAELSVVDGASRETRFQPQASSSCSVEAEGEPQKHGVWSLLRCGIFTFQITLTRTRFVPYHLPRHRLFF